MGREEWVKALPILPTFGRRSFPHKEGRKRPGQRPCSPSLFMGWGQGPGDGGKGQPGRAELAPPLQIVRFSPLPATQSQEGEGLGVRGNRYPSPSDWSARVGVGAGASGMWIASSAMTVPSLAGLRCPVFRSVTVCTPYGRPSITISRPNVPAGA